MSPDLELCLVVGESADRLLSAQVFMAGGGAALTSRNITKELYEAARKVHLEPLTSLAAKILLNSVKPRDTVVFTTGFFDPPSMIAEADGPIGAALLARALCAMLDATPVFLTEVANMGHMRALAHAAGMEVLDDLELARITPYKAVIVPLPIDPGRAQREAIAQLDRVKPAAFIAVEKPSPCPKGRYHTGRGLDVTDVVGKIDYIVNEARRRRIPTIGLGDGGNEVGMGCILDTIQEAIPTGKVIGTPLETDLLVVTAIANWGAYGIEACLAAALHAPDAMHSLADERRVIDAAAKAGLIDPSTGISNGWVDGTPPICSESILELLRQMVALRLAKTSPHSPLNFPKRWAERSDPDDVIAAWAKKLMDEENRLFASTSG